MNDIVKKGKLILTEAQALAKTAETRAEFSNALFDPRSGLVAKTFPKLEERQKFYDTDEYRAARGLLLKLTKKFGRTDSSVLEKSGKFVVRIPKTLHTTLEVEAKREGVSLNQLASVKLAQPLKGKKLTAVLVAEAFRQVHDGYSSDRIIVDPDLNARFLERCRDMGLRDESDYMLNHLLYDIRKSSTVELPKTTKPTVFKYDEFAFAAEIAIRSLQRSSGVSLDQVLCDPELRRKFDEIAQRLAPEQPVLKLRCAALNFRKTHRLKPGDINSPKYDLIVAGRVESLVPKIIPILPGAYVFYGDQRPLFAGESANLQQRIDRHLQHSGRQGLPSWLDVPISSGLELRYFADEKAKQETRLSWLRQFINSERPLLNYQRAA
jgi:hypothetical protein